MTRWKERELTKIGEAEELEIATARRNGTPRPPVTIWVVRDGEDLYVRSVNGRTGSWFRGAQERHESHVEAGGVNRDVSLVETNEMNDEVDAAYRTKYRQYTGKILNSVLTPQARAATLKLVPRS